MKTKADLKKQYLASMDAIRAKKAYAQKLMQEADEELIEAKLLQEDIEKEEEDVRKAREEEALQSAADVDFGLRQMADPGTAHVEDFQVVALEAGTACVD